MLAFPLSYILWIRIILLSFIMWEIIYKTILSPTLLTELGAK